MLRTFGDAHFEVTDDGRGPAVVLLHGFPLAMETWDAHAIALSSRARVVRMDLRGLGNSSVTTGPYLMESLAGDLADVLDALEVERATIVGHSLGGYVAFAFYRMFAERCLGLGLVCSRATDDDVAAASAREALALRAEREGIAPVVDAFAERYFASNAAPPRDALARVRAIAERTDPRGAAAMLRGMAARVSSEDLLDDIAIPVRVVAGAHDRFFGVEAVRPIAERAARGTLDVLACGHMPQYEAPDALLASLEALLADATG